MRAQKGLPELLEKFLQAGSLTEADICKTDDGFYAVKKSLPEWEGGFLYAVPGPKGYGYGQLWFYGQDTDAPGVVISFGEQKQLKKYFAAPQSQGAYLIAQLYVEQILSKAKGRHIGLPWYFQHLYRQEKGRRISRFVEINNEDAVHTVCDQETVYIRDLADVSRFEKLAILATHTGCTSFQSFAAGVQYYARPFGKETTARLCVSAETVPYHDSDSKWVKKQKQCHPQM